MKKNLFRILLISLLINIFQMIFAESYLYRMRNKGEENRTEYTIISENGKDVITIQDIRVEQKSVFVCEPENWNTVSFQMKTLEGASYDFERKGNTVHIEGKTSKGKEINLTEEIDSDPFYEMMDFQLKFFILSADKEITFWVLNPEDGKVYKFRGIKMGKETKNINGQKTSLIKVKLKVNGVPEFFFKQYVYFRKDGVFAYKDGKDWSVELIQ